MHLSLAFILWLIMLCMAVGLTPLGGWTRPAVWLAAALLSLVLVLTRGLVLS